MTFQGRPNTGRALLGDTATRDVILWADMKVGNGDALAQLYNTHFASLHKHGMCISKDRELVSDSIHELFSTLWSRREYIATATNVKVYLYRSLERILFAQQSRSKRATGRLMVDDLPSDSFEQLWIDGELRKERLSEIKKCLGSLPRCQREVILLKFYNDLTYQEISEIMNLQLASVYNLVSKAIEQLRQKMHFQDAVAS